MTNRVGTFPAHAALPGDANRKPLEPLGSSGRPVPRPLCNPVCPAHLCRHWLALGMCFAKIGDHHAD
jgi:hypothetical protein